MKAASSWPRRMLIYLGQNDMRSLAALIELAEMLMPSVTMIKPIAAKAAAARPPCEPLSIQWLMISMGFQRTFPYALCAAAAVKMPSSPTTAVDDMVSVIVSLERSRHLTKYRGNDNSLDILRAGLVCVSRKVSNIEAQSCVVSKDSVQIFWTVVSNTIHNM
jgi:hypothetical protein